MLFQQPLKESLSRKGPTPLRRSLLEHALSKGFQEFFSATRRGERVDSVKTDAKICLAGSAL